MAKKEFNGAAPAKINDYFITLTAGPDDMMRQQVRPFQFKRDLADWVAGETGCIPNVEVVKESVATDAPKVMISCTEALLDKIKLQFKGEIAHVEHIRKLSEIPPGERGCWKPRHGR